MILLWSICDKDAKYHVYSFPLCTIDGMGGKGSLLFFVIVCISHMYTCTKSIVFPWVFLLKETLVAADLRKTLSKLIFLKVVCEDQPFSG